MNESFQIFQSNYAKLTLNQPYLTCLLFIYTLVISSHVIFLPNKVWQSFYLYFCHEHKTRWYIYFPYIHSFIHAFLQTYVHTQPISPLSICILEPKFIIIILEFRSQVHISYIFVPSLIFMVTTRLFQDLGFLCLFLIYGVLCFADQVSS
ncbi:hypothetical protein HanPI659440_Chr11g0423661 [Helianthus annuus]|nr:hypothetical protein HanPI659440_Chr11g0423661 [Helianthus annuus]